MRYKVVALGVLAMLVIFNNANARAETGPKQYLDELCTHPAFVANTPVATLNGNKLQNNRIGLRAQNDYCSGPDVILPPDYGNPTVVIVVIP